jgi:PAS domain S-box-containing protein
MLGFSSARLCLTSIALPLMGAASVSASEPGSTGMADRLGVSGIAGTTALVLAGILVFILRRRLDRQRDELRAQMRHELELQAEHSDLIENANDVVFTLDRAGRITSFNRAGERLTGYSRGEVIGRTLKELSDPGSSHAVLANNADAQTFDWVIRTRSGRTATWEVSARPARRRGALAAINCIARDVTERKRAHDDLRRLYLMQAQQFDHSPLAFIEWDSAFRVVRWSRRAESIFGWSAEQATGKTFQELNLIHEDDVERVSKELALLLADQSFNKCQNRNYTRGGDILHVEWYNSTLRDEAGKLLCVMSLGHDVTAREKDEEQRRRLEDQVRQSQKMEAVGRLAGGVAHDFNNLLTVINGCAEMLVQASRVGDPDRELAQEIHRAGEQAALLTKQLLAFGRRQITKPIVLDLNDVVRDVEKMLRRLIGEHIILGVNLTPDNARVKADPGQMVQLLMNLVVNARDAMPGGGTVAVRTALAGNRVVLSVSDTGVGMDAATRARIFEPFFTTKGAGEGTGLGLATVHGIVEQSGGSISVASEPGQGTTFRIELPCCGDRSPAKTTAYVRRTDLRTRETILLVEDEDLVRSLAQRVLESRGYRVFAAPCGEDAIELHSRVVGKIDLVLSDVVMPGMGGRLLSEQLRDRQPGLRTLFMSGYTNDEVLRQGIQAEEVHFIQKPFSPDGLARKVREVLALPIQSPLLTAV